MYVLTHKTHMCIFQGLCKRVIYYGNLAFNSVQVKGWEGNIFLKSVYRLVALSHKAQGIGLEFFASVIYFLFLWNIKAFSPVWEPRQGTRKINDLIRAVRFCLFGSKDSRGEKHINWGLKVVVEHTFFITVFCIGGLLPPPFFPSKFIWSCSVHFYWVDPVLRGRRSKWWGLAHGKWAIGRDVSRRFLGLIQRALSSKVRPWQALKRL